MGKFTYRFKKYFSYSKRELLQAFATAAVAGFVISFNNWGTDALDISQGLKNLVLGVLFVMIALSLQIWAQKTTGLMMGYLVKYSYWKLGMLVSFLVAFLTNGFLPLFFTGTLDCEVKKTMRTGIYMPRFKQWEYGMISFAGPFSNLVAVLLLQPIFMATQSGIIYLLIQALLFTMLFSMIPLPLFHGVSVKSGGRTEYDFKGGTVGFNIFFANRALYLFFSFLMLAYAGLILIGNIFSFLLALLIAVVLVVVVMAKTENL